MQAEMNNLKNFEVNCYHFFISPSSKQVLWIHSYPVKMEALAIHKEMMGILPFLYIKV